MAMEDRDATLRAATAMAPALLVASDAAARGLDLPGVRHVVQARCCASCEGYSELFAARSWMPPVGGWGVYAALQLNSHTVTF
jgi:hypothetical protein